MFKKVLRLCVFVLTVMTVAGCGSEESVPGVQFEAFDLAGQTQSSDQWLGKSPLVLNFWGTWCGPCRREMPDLIKLYHEYSSRGVEMIGFAVNDTPDRVKSFNRQYNLPWIMLMADRQLMAKYGVMTGIPTTIFIDRNGRELKRYVGAQPYDRLKEGFDAIL